MSKDPCAMPSFLISDVRVFDGEFVTHDHGYVLIENNQIKVVSSVEPAVVPIGCIDVAGSGCTVIPGLIDAHVHPYHDISLLAKAIQYGVTTVIDMHNEPHWFRDLKEIANERNDVSDIRSVCYAATIKGGWPSAIVKLTSQESGVSHAIYPLLVKYLPRCIGRLTIAFQNGQILRILHRPRNTLPKMSRLEQGMRLPSFRSALKF